MTFRPRLRQPVIDRLLSWELRTWSEAIGALKVTIAVSKCQHQTHLGEEWLAD